MFATLRAIRAEVESRSNKSPRGPTEDVEGARLVESLVLHSEHLLRASTSLREAETTSPSAATDATHTNRCQHARALQEQARRTAVLALEHDPRSKHCVGASVSSPVDQLLAYALPWLPVAVTLAAPSVAGTLPTSNGSPSIPMNKEQLEMDARRLCAMAPNTIGRGRTSLEATSEHISVGGKRPRSAEAPQAPPSVVLGHNHDEKVDASVKHVELTSTSVGEPAIPQRHSFAIRLGGTRRLGRSPSPPPPPFASSFAAPAVLSAGAVARPAEVVVDDVLVASRAVAAVPPPPSPALPQQTPTHPFFQRMSGAATTEHVTAPVVNGDEMDGFKRAGDLLHARAEAQVRLGGGRGEQRGLSSSAGPSSISNRSPALGLRRGGFQPPFSYRRGGTEGELPTSHPANAPQSGRTAPTAPSPSLAAVSSAVLNTKKRITGDGAPAMQEEGGGEESYPESLLLPDGSVPPILQALDASLVTRVAREILEDGAGANITWKDIAGLQHAKSSVEEAIVWPLRRPDLFVGLRDPPRGLLLFGPPGTGKTMIARAIANESQCTFLNISAGTLLSKYVGENEQLIRAMFAIAKVKQPSVIFMDEIDSLLSMRNSDEKEYSRSMKTELFIQMDGVGTDSRDRILLIGATNRPDGLDEAARRRMEKRLYIPLPDVHARRELVERLLQQLQESLSSHQPGAASTDGAEPPTRQVHRLNEEDYQRIAERSVGFSGADLKQLCREASMVPLRELTMDQLSAVAADGVRPIIWSDFEKALHRMKPSVGEEDIQRHVAWNAQYGSFNLAEPL